MRVLDLAWKDILQVLRDWKSALFLVVMPVLFTLFFGLIFGSVFTPDQPGDPRLPVGLIDQDQGALLSAGLEELIANADAIRPVILSGEKAGQASQMVLDGELAGIVTIPLGYSQQVLEDRPASLHVMADRNTPSGQTVVNALEAVTVRLLGAVESAHISVEAIQARTGFESEAGRQAYLQDTILAALAAWERPPLQVQVEQATGEAFPDSQGVNVSGFIQSSSGMIVQFAIFGLITSSMILVLERKTGTLQRLLTTPMRRADVIGGHILAMFLVVFTQEAILVILGQYAFGVDYLRQPWAILLMMVALALWAASLGLLIGAISREEDQVIVLSLIAMFVFAAMGGAWFPLEVTGKTFAAIGHLLPSAWAVDGFQNIILRGLRFNSVLAPAGILFAFALAFFGLAIWRFKYE